MAITYFEKERIFKLDTPASSYVIGIVDKENFVGHVYYGKKLRDANIAYLLRTGEGPFVPSENNRERVSFYDTFPMEYAGNGLGDYRRSSISVRTAGGHTAVSQYLFWYLLYSRAQQAHQIRQVFSEDFFWNCSSVPGSVQLRRFPLRSSSQVPLCNSRISHTWQASHPIRSCCSSCTRKQPHITS